MRNWLLWDFIILTYNSQIDSIPNMKKKTYEWTSKSADGNYRRHKHGARERKRRQTSRKAIFSPLASTINFHDWFTYLDYFTVLHFSRSFSTFCIIYFWAISTWYSWFALHLFIIFFVLFCIFFSFWGNSERAQLHCSAWWISSKINTTMVFPSSNWQFQCRRPKVISDM